MKLTPLGSNQNGIQVGDMRVLFSYKTPVAAWVEGRPYKTDKKWSRTTSRHINSWFDPEPLEGVETKPQEFFDALI